jgi:AraC-like DNA-binding protein
VGEAAETAPTLGAALTLLCDAFAAVQTDTVLTLRVAEGRARLAYRILDPDIWPRDQDAALTLALFAGLAGRAAGPGWRPLALRFEHARAGPEAGPDAFGGAATRYGAAENALAMPESLLSLPMPTAEPQRFRGLAPAALGCAREVERAASLRRRARREIWRRLGAEPVDRSAVAAAVGLSERTFRRRLAEEGAGFSDLLADCRLRLARRMLESADDPVAAVAARLGYSDATAFERAFRRGTGLTPAEHRRMARAPASGLPGHAI